MFDRLQFAVAEWPGGAWPCLHAMMGRQRVAGMAGMGWRIIALTVALPVPAGVQVSAGITLNNRDTGAVADRITISSVLRRPVMLDVMQVAVLFVCLVAVREAGILQTLELRVYDFFLELFIDEVAEDPTVALINITESDIQQLGQWPLSDESHAALLTTLQAARSAFSAGLGLLLDYRQVNARVYWAHGFDDTDNGNLSNDLQDDGVHFSVSFSAF